MLWLGGNWGNVEETKNILTIILANYKEKSLEGHFCFRALSYQAIFTLSFSYLSFINVTKCEGQCQNAQWVASVTCGWDLLTSAFVSVLNITPKTASLCLPHPGLRAAHIIRERTLSKCVTVDPVTSVLLLSLRIQSVG